MRQGSLILAVALMLACSSSAHGAIITFDSLVNNSGSGGEIKGDEFAALGIIFSTPDLQLNIGTTPPELSQPNSLGADALDPDDFDGTLILQFTDNQFATDLTFSALNPPFQASAYDVDGNLLTTINGMPAPFTQFFDFSGFPVHRVVVTGEFYAIDDVSFGTLQSASEPATLTMLGMATAAAAGYYGWRRRRRTA